MKTSKVLLWGITLFLFFPSLSVAVDVAPRITDREIVERLTRLEEGQKAILQRFDAIDKRFDAIDKRFESIDKRFESIDKRFESIDKRFESIDKQFERIDSRIEKMGHIMMWGFGLLFTTMIGTTIGMIGFVLWDRRTALAPAIRESKDLREKEERLEKILKEIALKDANVAEAIRHAGLI